MWPQPALQTDLLQEVVRALPLALRRVFACLLKNFSCMSWNRLYSEASSASENLCACFAFFRIARSPTWLRREEERDHAHLLPVPVPSSHDICGSLFLTNVHLDRPQRQDGLL